MDNKAALKDLQSVVRDTSGEMLLKQQEMWQEFSDEKKLLLTMELMSDCMQLLKANIKNRHPEWNAEEVQIEVLNTLYRDKYSEEDFKQLIKSVKEYNKKYLLI